MRAAAAEALVLPAVAVAALMAFGGSLDAASAEGSSRPCESDGSVTLAATREARVYQVEKRRGDHATLFTYGCLRSSGSPVLLASDAEPAALFPRPAISLVGTYVGYAVDTDTDPTAPGGRMTYVEVDDLRPQQPGFEEAGLVVSAGPRSVARVGSLKVSRRGSVAWIACPAPSDGPLTADPDGRCTRPGAPDHVYRATLDRHGNPRVALLDKGRSIDPSSLRRARRSSVVWRHGRTTAIAKLH
jgi:hypothetical protein